MKAASASRIAERQYATRRPVPWHRCNPRRGYDKTGRELKPVTVGMRRRNGTRTVEVYCEACLHHATISTDGLPDHVAVPDVGLRLRCSACGSREIRSRIDIQAHYAQCFGPNGAVGAAGGKP